MTLSFYCDNGIFVCSFKNFLVILLSLFSSSFLLATTQANKKNTYSLNTGLVVQLAIIPGTSNILNCILYPRLPVQILLSRMCMILFYMFNTLCSSVDYKHCPYTLSLPKRRSCLNTIMLILVISTRDHYFTCNHYSIRIKDFGLRLSLSASQVYLRSTSVSKHFIEKVWLHV